MNHYVINEFECNIHSVADGIVHFEAKLFCGKKYSGNYPESKLADLGITSGQPFICRIVLDHFGKSKLQFSPSESA